MSESIPPEFYKTEEEVPFDTCTFCDRPLSEDVVYVIEKKFKPNAQFMTSETIYEFAMCIGCMSKMAESMSQETMQNIQAYMHDMKMETDFHEREYMNLEVCVFEGKSKFEYGEFQLVGLFNGDEISEELLPYGVGGSIIDHLQTLISKKTQDSWDGYTKHLDIVPPELRDLFDKPPILA